MSKKIITLAICMLVLPAIVARADTIYLKNGMYIVVRKVAEKDGQIEYWVAGTKYSIPKSSVEKIEAGDGPNSRVPATLGAPGVKDLTRREGSAPAAAREEQNRIQLSLPDGPKQDDLYWTALRNRILQGDRIDRMRLAEIEMEHNVRTTTNAFFLAGVVEAQRGNVEAASTYFARAIRLEPNDPNLLEWHAVALSNLGMYRDAVSELERATKLKPDSVHILQLLGLAQYNAGYTSDAVTSWNRVLKLSSDEYTEGLLHKAERELEINRRSRQKQSWHFTLHYEGDKTAPELQQQLLETLETQYRDLARLFAYEPRENIIVILYTQKEFFDMTEAPSWAGALNDGKLRIPIRGVTTTTPELEHVLKHELTHSFVRSLGGARCPVWLNEGLAQLMEPRSSTIHAQSLASLFHQRQEIPLSVLERSFTRFSDVQAEVAYAESLSAVEYLRDRYGMGEIVRMLQTIGSGSSAEEALHHSTGLDYALLERKIGEYLTGPTTR